MIYFFFKFNNFINLFIFFSKNRIMFYFLVFLILYSNIIINNLILNYIINFKIKKKIKIL